MKPRAIEAVPGLDPNAKPFERFTEFARRIIQTPKLETEKENKLAGPAKSRDRRKKK